MPEKRIETTTSRTAEWTCVSRAASVMETRPHYKSDDHIAPMLLPAFMKLLLQVPLSATIFKRLLIPKGIYEYVIARTQYIDGAFKQALNEQFEQILVFGAGFDTRALRFHEIASNTKIFELDVPATQNAKISQYQKRNLTVPPNLVFIPIDFDRESLPHKLEEGGFQKCVRSLFIMEGLLMYLQPQSVEETFQVMRNFSGGGSRVVFDYVLASVLRRDNEHYGESGIYESVSSAGEQWQFGIEEGEIVPFLTVYDFKLLDHKDAQALERQYFTGADGETVGRINSTHCLVTAEKL